MSQLTAARVPVGFRFHPTDEELVGYYLPKKVGAIKIDLDLIRDLDLYKLEPWDLQELCKIQADTNEKQTDYYFFSRKDKKYPTGNRANRATTKGFWKATGRDKPIYTKLQTLIGMRKTLVFYEGRAPHGVKTDWIMHEFRLDDGPGRPAHEDGGWVVCRVFKKNKNFKMKMQERACSFEEQIGLLPEMSSPDILSGGGGSHQLHHHHHNNNSNNNNNSSSSRSYTFPNNHHHHHHHYGVKQEVINLDEYNPCGHGQYFNSLAQLGMNKLASTERHSMPSASECRSLIIKKDDYLVDPYPENSLSVLEEPQSSVNNNINNNEEAISGLENLDWNALYEAPGKEFRSSTAQVIIPGTTATAKSEPLVGGDMSILLQLKRQNSDILSSLDLWNYTQVAQQK